MSDDRELRQAERKRKEAFRQAMTQVTIADCCVCCIHNDEDADVKGPGSEYLECSKHNISFSWCESVYESKCGDFERNSD